MNLSSYLEERRKKIDLFLDRHFHPADGSFARLFEAVRYSLLAGGKRIRPILVLASFEAVRSSDDPAYEAAIRVGAALEMIHTYSLVHDDLPAMDNDDLRRGRPTNHKAFGEATAILAGDVLLTEAFGVIADSKNVPAEALLKVIEDIAEASGGRGMAGGQALDLECEGREGEIDLPSLENLHRHKTGCLIRVSVTSGAKIVGTSAENLSAIEQYGENIGLAFQIADDILDVEGGAEEMGKATGGDAKKGKATYPAILGLQPSKELAQRLVDKAIVSLEKFDAKADPLREIARYIVARRS